MKKITLKTLALAAVLPLFFACSKDKPKEENPDNQGNYILAVKPTAATNVADYLVTAADLEKGSVSIVGNGVEQDGSIRYYLTVNSKLFSLLYGQANPGAVSIYNILGGKLNRISNFQSETVHVFQPINNDILLIKIGYTRNSSNKSLANYYIINSSTNLIEKEGTIDATAVAGNGEDAYFTGVNQVGSKVYATFQTSSQNYYTKFPDEAWVAVFSYPDMKLEKVIKDDRTSFLGRHLTNGLQVMENGDIYGFSSSVGYEKANNDPESWETVRTSTNPSAILKIKSGTTEFDKDYFFNFETKSSNYYITDWLYVGNNKFVAHVSPTSARAQWGSGKELAIVDVVAQTVVKVTGLPQNISSVSLDNYTEKDGKAFFGINTTTGSYVYKVDAATATATQGLKVDGGTVTAIKYLK